MDATDCSKSRKEKLDAPSVKFIKSRKGMWSIISF